MTNKNKTKPIVTDEMVDAAWREFGSCTIANKKHARAYLEAALAVAPAQVQDREQLAKVAGSVGFGSGKFDGEKP